MSAPTRIDIDALLAQMSIEEKVGQMTQLTIDVIAEGKPYQLKDPLTINEDKLREALLTYHVGSILNVGTHAHPKEHWQKIIHQIQETAIKGSRHGIPVIYGIDSVHGANYTKDSTLFPQQLAIAATWDTSFAKQGGVVTAYETRASAIPWVFSPVLDLGRHPLWPRIWETFGEDVHLSTQMGLAMLEGLQGEDGDYSKLDRVAACIKHFAGYSFPVSGKDRTPVWMGERQLREYFLPGFQATINAGAPTIMVNSGEINGIPVHVNAFILKTILRDELGFKGVALTDWEDIQYLHTRHRVAATQKEAVRMAIEAGIDMSMVPLDYSFNEYLVELVKEGSITEERIDESVRRILELKAGLGLFDQAAYPVEDYPDFGSPSFEAQSRKAAEESIILAKNENSLLPLSTERKYLLVGPTADSARSINGGWTYTWQGERSDQLNKRAVTIKTALERRLGAEQLVYELGCDFEAEGNVDAAVAAAAQVDAIILCLGESSYTEFFGNINDLNLPPVQLELVNALIQTAKPIVLVMAQGRPRIISSFADEMSSIVLGFYPGDQGGEAIAAALFGEINPSGKLPITYPRHPNSLETYDHKYTEASSIQGGPIAFQPQFEFGHGLSYTSFSYSDLSLSATQLTANEELSIHFTLRNSGKRAGKEVVQLYVSDLFASITPPVKRLRGFEKIELEAGEEKKVEMRLAISDLAFVGRDQKWVVEPGEFRLKVGDLEATFEVIEG